jgi:hypothetical protein
MSIYYYTPFKSTDDNERATWNLCLQWGARFANCAQGQAPLTPTLRTVESLRRRKYITPVELADKLVADGLPNKEFNILLVVCFGGGVQPNAKEFKDWEAGTGAANGFAKLSIAQSLARSLGARQDFPSGEKGAWLGRVGGFAGPTYTKGGSFQVTLPSPPDSIVRDDAWSHAHWYKAGGNESEPHRPNGFEAQKGITGLTELRGGDQLRIMAHGDWKGGGRILPFPGEGQEDLQTMEVDRVARLAGRSDDRIIIDTGKQSSGSAFAKKKLEGFTLLLARGSFSRGAHGGMNRVIVANDGGGLDFAIFGKDGKYKYEPEASLQKKKRAIATLKTLLDPKWPGVKSTQQFNANDPGVPEIVEQVGVILGWGQTEQ